MTSRREDLRRGTGSAPLRAALLLLLAAAGAAGAATDEAAPPASMPASVP